MTRTNEALLEAARVWIDGDPDAETRRELEVLVSKLDFEQLRLRLSPLSFGTAGLRARVGAGSGYMNGAVVRLTAFGIARYLLGRADEGQGPVVIGFDARPTSRAFAEISTGVFLAAGLQVLIFPEPIATPLVAFSARELGARLAIVVTASHNPRADQGYKVYGENAVQIAAPVDLLIAAEIANAPAARKVPCEELSLSGDAERHPRLTLASAALVNRYFETLAAELPRGHSARALPIVYSALHGVGWEPVKRALSEAGFSAVEAVPEQAVPDGSFPTTPFPNPEEPGTLDLAFALGNRTRAELLLVNDPDADRLAAVARLDGQLVALDGNQLGVLLADYCLARYRAAERPLILSSVVSSPLVERLALSRGAHHERTLTGFKWLWSAALSLEQAGVGRFCFAYEEALGYSLFSAVHDKDGISAARALAELAATLHASGQTLFDRLFELYSQYGLWASAARNVTLPPSIDPAKLRSKLDQLAAQPPLELVGQRIARVIDYEKGAEHRPLWLGKATLLELALEGGARLFVRPSGTEPKLKLYAHVSGDVALRHELASSLLTARSLAASLLEGLEGALNI